MNLYFDKLVIGSSLESLLFCFYGKHKSIYTRSLCPDSLETIEDFGMGTNKKGIWNTIAFQLGLGGYFPFENKIKHIVYIENNKIKIVTQEEKIYFIIFNKLYVFDDFNFLDLPPSLSTTSNKVKIIDWFNAEKGCYHNYDIIENESNFLNQIIFFKSAKRRDAKRKDVCVVSYCQQQELEKYPDHLVRIKTENIMRDLKIQNFNKTLTYIKLNHIKRDVINYGQNIYENFDNVEFVYDDAKTIFEINQGRHKIDYMKYIRLKLGL